ncbi:SAM-dependent methyltransferase [Streptomyces sp. NPDC094448]|uniref:SAM-dependent methyltransferase n=1 Tax=Streptomyces sp. NPDC094448 TaxID=3366063 RepID=UPI00382503BC
MRRRPRQPPLHAPGHPPRSPAGHQPRHPRLRPRRRRPGHRDLRRRRNPRTPRTREEIAEFFTGRDLAEPGLVPTRTWRPDPDGPMDTVTDAEASTYAAIARNP